MPEGRCQRENPIDLPQTNGGVLRVRKLRDDFDPTDRLAALHLIQSLQAKGEVATGLLHAASGAADLHATLQTSAMPLNRLAEPELCPGAAVLARFNASLR